MSGADEQEAAAFYREEAEAYRAIARLIATPIIVDILLALAEELEQSATRCCPSED